MFKKTILSTVLLSGFIAAGAASAGQTNPLHPAYQHFAATKTFATKNASVKIAANPLQPSFYQRSDIRVAASAKLPKMVDNNPLQPGFKRA